MTTMSRDGAKTWWGVDLPRDVIYMWHDGGHLWPGLKREWQVFTRQMLNEKKREKNEWNLSIKLRSEKIVPGYIWVFRVDWFLFGGWWIYIKTHKQDYGISFKYERDIPLVERIMSMVPLGVFPLYDNFDLWAVQFAKRYRHVGLQRKKNQGLLKCRCFIDEYGKLTDIQL